ncbi:MAG: 8-oxo-dGTP diphosphatase [Spirochaetia bacterium]
MFKPTDWNIWQPTERAVLCFVRKKNKVLLINKKRGLGAGLINAPGGRIEPGEAPVDAAARETEEETGIKPSLLKLMGDLSFQFTDGYSLFGKIYVSWNFAGKLRETDEADPFWCSLKKIPFDKMWEDDKFWLPYLLTGRFISGKFVFDQDKMKTKQIIIL